MGVYTSGVSKRTVIVDGKKAAFTRFWGKAPYRYDLSGEYLRRWNTFYTKSENAAKFHEYSDEPVVYLIYGDKLENGATVAWYRPRVATVDDGYWDNWTVGTLKKVGRGKWTVEPVSWKSTQMSESQFKNLTHFPHVTKYARVNYDGLTNRYVFSPRPDIGMSEHSLDADCTDLDRLNAHFAGYCEVASEKF